MAELLGEEPGERVGYAVRLERKVSPRTRIEVLTEGLLVRHLQGAPELPGVSTVIFDEFHERSIHTDLALALMMDLRRMGSPVRLLFMSATLDAHSLARFLEKTGDSPGGPVSCFDCPGRRFPVAISYRPLPEKGPLGRECAGALAAILREEPGEPVAGDVPPGNPLPIGGGGEANRDILVFLPGRREISGAAGALAALLPAGTAEILPLHGSLPLARQREITTGSRSGSRRRIILSTNLAESSLTIPGIGLVVDSGMTRRERCHLPSGMNRLVTERVDRNGAEQRAGRAGRLGPGRCIRLWAEEDRRPENTESEIRRTDLSGLVLECLLWGVREREALPWLEAPSPAAWSAALELLQNLGAVDSQGRPSPQGREMARLGLESRLAALCVTGKERAAREGGGAASLAAASAALLAGRDFPEGAGDGDFRRRLAPLRSFAQAPRSFRGAEAARIQALEESAGDLLRRLFPEKTFPPPGQGRLFSWGIQEEAGVGELLAAAFPDRIGRGQYRELSGGIVRFPSGREGRIEGPLGQGEWLVAVEADAGERQGYIRWAAPLSREGALAALAPWTRSEQEIHWQGLVPRTVVSRRAGKIVLAEERRKSRREEAAGALRELLGREGLSLLPWEEMRGKTRGESPRQLLERIRFFAATGTPRKESGDSVFGNGSAGSSPWDAGTLTAEAAEWLGPFLWEGVAEGEGPVLSAAALSRALKNRFGLRYGWDLAAELDALAPPYWELPNGKKRPLEYGSGEPSLSLRLQDAFGLTGEQRIRGTPVSFVLLSPAGRPLQITRDLQGFWAGSYAGIRRELRGRYPKHPWPEDPRRTSLKED
jgi:ATP-dependent helicase HrpB